MNTYPPSRAYRPWQMLSVLVLIACLYYIYAYVFLVPYPGLEYDGQWTVLSFDGTCGVDLSRCLVDGESPQVGDRLVAIGDVTYQAYRVSRSVVPFAGYKPGDVVSIAFEREGVAQQALWRMPGPTVRARLYRLGLLFPFLPFWLAGTIVLYFLRPIDDRWRLLIAFNYITALWWVAGMSSSTQIAASATVMRVLTWLLIPIYLHLHSLIPSSLLLPRFRYPVFALYGLTGLLAGLEILRALPSSAYYLGLLISLVGSLGLLISRLVFESSPSIRLATRQILAGVALASIPGFVLWVAPRLLDYSQSSLFSLYFPTLAVALLPFFYIYALYKRRMGGLEFRANRILSFLSFLVLYVTAFVVVFVFGSQRVQGAVGYLAFSATVSGLFVALALALRDPFQRFIDRLAYGTEHNPDDILRTFANEIPRALNRGALVHLLTREVCPALLIRQSALYLTMDGDVSLFYAYGVEIDEHADASEPVHRLLAEANRYRPPDLEPRDAFDWVRLAIPIEVGGKRIGVWLLGKRDPDDYYPKPDIELLGTLANQIGVALETARLFERLRQRAMELERAYEELRELDQLKDEFIQNISHELRTPLTFVRGYAELLLEGMLGELTPEQRQAMETVADRTEGLIRLVNDIISMQQSAIEQLELEPVNLVALAHSCVQAVEIAAQKRTEPGKEFRFVLDVAEDLPQVWGDRGRLRQVFDNLLNNAVKFSPNGGTITVRIRPSRYPFPGQDAEAQPQPAVEVSVSDQGIGIPADKLDRIWERFYQVDGSSSRQFGGMGLGLAIVRNIVEAHGGVIWVESAEGVGTTFRFVLPALTASDQSLSSSDGRFDRASQESADSHEPADSIEES